MIAKVSSKTPLFVAMCAAILLVAAPFFAPLSIWTSSRFGHYTVFRLWDDILIIIGLVGAVWFSYRNRLQYRTGTWQQRLLLSIGGYILLQVGLGFVAYVRHDVNSQALGQALIINLRLIALFAIGVIAARNQWIQKYWPYLLLIPAAIVIFFGLLQIAVLPKDILRHIGYNSSTILPYETINNNRGYIRIISTLRGANPLGTYMLFILCTLAVLWNQKKSKLLKITYIVLACGSAVVLFFSFSRSAWLGTIVSLMTFLLIKRRNIKWHKNWLILASATVFVIAITAISLRHNIKFENIILHTQQHSKILSTSNHQHSSAVLTGLKDVIHQPLGEGPGTAGPASVHNNHPARIAENYFIQVAQETGIIGLILFGIINVSIIFILKVNYRETLPMIVLISFLGLVLVNLFSHAWTDDTIAITWWLVAGIACSPQLIN